MWYLTPDEGHSGDGARVRYLLPGNEHPYLDCDGDLYRRLRALVMSGERSVAAVRAHGILPRGTMFLESLLSPAGLPKREMPTVRADWHNQALAATHSCDLVFLDPDNGLEPVGMHGGGGIKHALLSEIRDYQCRNQNVVLYHHLGRSSSHAEQVESLRGRLATEGVGPPPIILRMTSGPGRVFAVLPTADQQTILSDRADAFVQGPWGALFAYA